MIDVSYVITVYNKAASLDAVYDSLRAQTGGLAVEFIFVDDASTDGSVKRLRYLAADDRRIRIVENADNRGPSVRLNQGARAAQGRWLHMLDGDDLLPTNATARMLREAEDAEVPLVYGRRPRGAPEPIPETAAFEVKPAPLVFAASRPIVHMAVLVARQVFAAAGGADQTVFIQDQSLPLRLASVVPAMLWTEAGVCFAPGEGALSKNRMQQHHDRFVSARNLLTTLPANHEAAPALRRLCVSARWKARRDAGGYLSAAALGYLGAKAGFGIGDGALEAGAREMSRLPGVRRP